MITQITWQIMLFAMWQVELPRLRKENRTMNEKLIYGGEATLEDLYRLNQLGFEFVIEDGVITNVSH